MMDSRINAPTAVRRQYYELEIAFCLIIILSGVYVAYDMLAVPRGGHPFGHWLGITGTTLMIMTETLYSLRKRTRLLNWAGPVRAWLAFHIITGLVGPFLVLMHTGLQFRGLAGLTFVLTVIVVASGFIGRYLYTYLQRFRGQSARSHQQASLHVQKQQAVLDRLVEEKPTRVRQIVTRLDGRTNRQTTWGRWRYRRQLNRELRRLERVETKQRRLVEKGARQEAKWRRQVGRLDETRRWFQLWHTVHIPIGLTLFVATAVHILAAFYFRAGLFK